MTTSPAAPPLPPRPPTATAAVGSTPALNVNAAPPFPPPPPMLCAWMPAAWSPWVVISASLTTLTPPPIPPPPASPPMVKAKQPTPVELALPPEPPRPGRIRPAWSLPRIPSSRTSLPRSAGGRAGVTALPRCVAGASPLQRGPLLRKGGPPGATLLQRPAAVALAATGPATGCNGKGSEEPYTLPHHAQLSEIFQAVKIAVNPTPFCCTQGGVRCNARCNGEPSSSDQPL